MKIISLVPSITETLFDLGLSEAEIIGRTKFCIHPKNRVENLAIIGGTKNLNIAKINVLKPDLIIANKEENTKEEVEELQKHHKVLVTNISTLEDNYYLLKNLGILLSRKEAAQKFNIKIYEVFQSFSNLPKKKCAYLIWQNPYMTVGSDTFIHDVLNIVGFENIFKHHKRYPEIQIEDLRAAEFIFLSTEPFPFKQKHVEKLQKQLPDSKVLLVDGEAFSWYGTHVAKCENYFKGLVEKCQ